MSLVSTSVRARTVWFAVVGVLAVAPTVLLAGRGWAAEPVARGWWYALQDSSIPLAVPPPAEVPDDGLFVAANVAGDEAMSALRFSLASAERPATLTLKVSGEIVGTPVILLCPTTTTWSTAQGGAWDTRPGYSCSDEPPVGTASTDGTAIVFPIGKTGDSTTIDVALVPGHDATGTTPAFRVAFERPGLESLKVVQSLPEGAGGDLLPDDVTGPASSFAVGNETNTVPEALFGGTPRLLGSPSAGGGVAYDAAAAIVGNTGVGDAIGFTQSPVASQNAASTDNDLRTVGLLGLACVGWAVVRLNGHAKHEPRSLLHFHARDADVEAA